MKKVFAFILGITAIALAITSASYSVYGLSRLFVGAFTAVVVMASILEFSKIVVVSFLHQYWKRIQWTMKMYLSVAVFSLMLITSAGIYGFLSSAYSYTSITLQKNSGVIAVFDKKIDAEKNKISMIKEQIETKTGRINMLTNIRKSQEIRVDSLYQRGWYRSARKTEKIIEDANTDIKSISDKIEKLNEIIQVSEDSISSYELSKLKVKNNKEMGDVGPLKYVSEMTGKDMDSVANILILLFVFLIDPLAILLVISTNKMIKLIYNDKHNIKEIKEQDLNDKQYKDEQLSEHIVKQVNDNYEFENVVEDKQGVADNVGKRKEETKQIVTNEQESNTVVDEYVENNSGDFVKINQQKDIDKQKHYTFDIKDNLTVSGILTAKTQSEQIKNEQKQEKTSFEIKEYYKKMLQIFYKNGDAKVGDDVLSFKEFKDRIIRSGEQFDEKKTKDFLEICALLNVVELKGKTGVFLKTYQEAIEIFSKV